MTYLPSNCLLRCFIVAAMGLKGRAFAKEDAELGVMARHFIVHGIPLKEQQLVGRGRMLRKQARLADRARKRAATLPTKEERLPAKTARWLGNTRNERSQQANERAWVIVHLSDTFPKADLEE
jgi:hypothetical protein